MLQARLLDRKPDPATDGWAVLRLDAGDKCSQSGDALDAMEVKRFKEIAPTVKRSICVRAASTRELRSSTLRFLKWQNRGHEGHPGGLLGGLRSDKKPHDVVVRSYSRAELGITSEALA